MANLNNQQDLLATLPNSDFTNSVLIIVDVLASMGHAIKLAREIIYMKLSHLKAMQPMDAIGSLWVLFGLCL